MSATNTGNKPSQDRHQPKQIFDDNSADDDFFEDCDEGISDAVTHHM
jgi:hypothetical protein